MAPGLFHLSVAAKACPLATTNQYKPNLRRFIWFTVVYLTAHLAAISRPHLLPVLHICPILSKSQRSSDFATQSNALISVADELVESALDHLEDIFVGVYPKEITRCVIVLHFEEMMRESVGGLGKVK